MEGQRQSSRIVMTHRTRWIPGLLAVGVAWLAVWLTIGYLWPLPRPAADNTTIRLYAGKEEIAVLDGLSRRAQVWRPLDRFPAPVTEAVLTAEDRRFFQHHGVDIIGVIRAIVANARHGGIREGASTITQQLARTLFLTREHGWGRKAREGVLALLLEFRYSKPRIFEAYLNTVYLGEDAGVAVYGLPAAARHFLGKDIGALRVDEAALLAAAISSPNKTLGERFERARTTRDKILAAMRRRGAIDDRALQASLAQPLPNGPHRLALRAPYFVDMARDEISRRLSLPSTGEVRIMTSLDPALQRAAERSLRDGLARIERASQRKEPLGRLDGAVVAIEPASGQVRALVGGRRYLDSSFNRATRAVRQPGSLFKPFVYLAAFEASAQGQGGAITAASLVADESLTVESDGHVWTPRNMDRRLLGSVTVRRALEESRNVPAVRVALDVGLDRVVEVARRLGIESPLAAVPSLALGTSGVTPLEITGAYAALANHGVRTIPTTLRDSAAMTGVQMKDAPAPAQVVSAESAFLVTHMLRGVMERGTGQASRRWGLSEVTAGKSGTTDGLRDAWFVGFTPDLVIGVWVGRDDGSPLGMSGAEAALPIWATTMAAAVRAAPPRPFTPPPGVVLMAVDRNTGKPASFWCDHGAMVEEAFRAGTEPKPECEGGGVAAAARRVLEWFQGVLRSGR